MARFASAFWRWTGAGVAAIMCVAMLSSPGAVASQNLFGMADQGILGGTTPVAIDPTTGAETQVSPGTNFVGNAFDVVSSANTLYIIDALSPTLLYSVSQTTGALNFASLNLPILDMAVAPVTGKLFGMADQGGILAKTPVAITPAKAEPPGPKRRAKMS